MPDETKEEAQHRRAAQAEKRRLAAQKAEEEKQKRGAKRKNEQEGVDDSRDRTAATVRKAPPKRARMAATGEKAVAKRKRRQSIGKKEKEKESIEVEEEHAEMEGGLKEIHEEEVETGSFSIDGGDEADEAKGAVGQERVFDSKNSDCKAMEEVTEGLARKPVPLEKRSESSHPSNKEVEQSQIRRITQAVKSRSSSARKPASNSFSTAGSAVTPPRSRVSATSKPPFGSPMPPQQPQRAAHSSKDPPSYTSGNGISVGPPDSYVISGTVLTADTSEPNRSVAGGSAAPMFPSDSSGTILVTPRAYAPDPPVVAARPLVSVHDPSKTNCSNMNTVAVPNYRDLSQLYAELERLENDKEDFDDDCSSDYDGSSDDQVNEELRQQALQVIADRRERERVQQLQVQAAARLRQQERDLREAALNRRRALWMRPVIFVLAIVSLSVLLGYAPFSWVPVELMSRYFFGASPVQNRHVCFLDSLDPDLKIESVEMDLQCVAKSAEDDSIVEESRRSEDAKVQWLPCPVGAVCRGGRLISCPQWLEIHENSCSLSAETNRTIAAIQQLLHSWTVRSYCSVDEKSKTGDMRTRAGRPFFPYSSVVGELDCEFDLTLMRLGNETWSSTQKQNLARFVVEQGEGEGNFWVALHPDQPVKISTFCQVGRVLLGLSSLAAYVFSIVYSLVWRNTIHVSLLYYHVAMAQPALVGAITVVVIVISFALNRRYIKYVELRERELAVAEAREKVYLRLQQEQQRYASNASTAPDISSERLCNDLAWEMHEMSSTARKQFVQQLWPLVKAEIYRDPSVEKIGRSEGGKHVEYWKFVGSGSLPNGQKAVQCDC